MNFSEHEVSVELPEMSGLLVEQVNNLEGLTRQGDTITLAPYQAVVLG